DGLDILSRDVGIAVGELEPRKDDEREKDVEDYARGNDDHPLPDRLRPKLPLLRFGLEKIRVHTLIDHPRNLDVPAERRRPDHILGLPNLLAEDLRRESNRKSIDPHLEELGEKKVAHLMHEHENGDREDHPEYVRKDLQDGLHAELPINLTCDDAPPVRASPARPRWGRNARRFGCRRRLNSTRPGVFQ